MNLIYSKPLIVIIACLFTSISTKGQEYKITRITDNVIECKSFYNEEHRTFTIISDSGLVQIDTYYFGWLTQGAKQLIQDSLKRNDFNRLITTHAHSCHIRGNYCFNETQQIAHKNVTSTYDKIRHHAQKMYNKLSEAQHSDSAQLAELSEAKILINLPNPDIVIDDSLNLNLGNININLYYFGNSGHADSELLIYVIEEQTLIIGQILGRSYFLPIVKENVTAADLEHKIKTLDLVLNKDIKNILSNHQGRIAKKDLQFAKAYYQNLLYDAKYMIERGISLEAFKSAFALERKYPNIKKRHHITNDHIQQNQQNIEAVFNMYTH